jgi:hypothetical protein
MWLDRLDDIVVIKEAGVSLLTPDVNDPVRAGDLADRFAVLYLRSYLLLRAFIGFTGLALPVVLIVGDHLLDANAPTVRGSLSAYYFSGTRDFLVSGLSAAGVFLITYKIFERGLNNLLSLVAGLAALGTAFFPTDRAEPGASLTPLQVRIGPGIVADVHFVSAAVFLVSLAIISFIFGAQEGRRPRQRPTRRAMLSPTFWRWFHWICAFAVLAGLGFAVLAKRQNMTAGHPILIGEIVALVAFGLSWLFKGLELDILFGARGARRTLATRQAP